MRVPVRDKPESLHHSRNFFFSPLKVEAEKKKFMSSVPESVQNLPKSMQKFFQYINNLKFEVKQREWSWLRHLSWDRIQILTILFETWLIFRKLYGPRNTLFVCPIIHSHLFHLPGFLLDFWFIFDKKKDLKIISIQLFWFCQGNKMLHTVCLNEILRIFANYNRIFIFS